MADEALFETSNMALYEFLAAKGHRFMRWRNDLRTGTELFWFHDSYALRNHVRQFEAMSRGPRNRAVGRRESEVLVRTPEQLIAALTGTA